MSKLVFPEELLYPPVDFSEEEWSILEKAGALHLSWCQRKGIANLANSYVEACVARAESAPARKVEMTIERIRDSCSKTAQKIELLFDFPMTDETRNLYISENARKGIDPKDPEASAKITAKGRQELMKLYHSHRNGSHEENNTLRITKEKIDKALKQKIFEDVGEDFLYNIIRRIEILIQALDIAANELEIKNGRPEERDLDCFLFELSNFYKGACGKSFYSKNFESFTIFLTQKIHEHLNDYRDFIKSQLGSLSGSAIVERIKKETERRKA